MTQIYTHVNYRQLKQTACNCAPSIPMRSTHATLGVKSGFPGITAYPFVGRIDTSDQAVALARQPHCIRTAPGSFCDAVQLPGGAKHNARIFLHKPFTQWVPKCGHGHLLSALNGEASSACARLRGLICEQEANGQSSSEGAVALHWRLRLQF
jgi:hypothetical protein